MRRRQVLTFRWEKTFDFNNYAIPTIVNRLPYTYTMLQAECITQSSRRVSVCATQLLSMCIREWRKKIMKHWQRSRGSERVNGTYLPQSS